MKLIEKNPLIPAVAAFGLLTLASPAALVGIEGFDYADGSIIGLTGGTGWTYERTDEPAAPAQTPSNWNNVFGNSAIVSSTLVTSNGGVLREFGGVTEGTGSTSNEREGAFRASGILFFSTSMTVAAMLPEGENQWAGVSTYDFGAERIFFGLPGQGGATRFFGIGGAGGGDVFSTIPVTAGTTYTIAGMLDFDNDRVGLWVDPDGGDNASSYDVSAAYTGTNWMTGLRLGSGTDVAWDNLTVGTEFVDVIPEPSSSLLAFTAAILLVNRRRRA